MKRTFITGAAIAAASLTTLWTLAGPPPLVPSAFLPAGLAGRGMDYVSRYRELGDARVLVVVASGIPANPHPHTDAEGLMATRMRVSILDEGGTLYSFAPDDDLQFPVLFAAIEPGTSTIEYTFDPPLRIGDGYSSAFMGSATVTAVEFYGAPLPPASIGGETMVVE